MEDVYLKGFTSRREWCTDHVNIKPYFHKYNEVLSFCMGRPCEKKGIHGELDILHQIVPKTKELSTDQLSELFESIK